MKRYAALFVREDSAYKKRPEWEAFDAKRDAISYRGSLPVACHPPCRKWGMLSHMAHAATPWEQHYAHWCVAIIHRNGGILEHPAGSRVFGKLVPDVGEFPDEHGGYTILIDQFDFGHVAHKNTKLYICGVSMDDLPPLPPKRLEHTDRSICGNVKGTTRCTQYQREYSPEALIDWFEKALDRCGNLH